MTSEFYQIDNLIEIDDYLSRGFDVIQNVSSFPIRLHALQADIYAGKYAAIKNASDFCERYVSKGTIVITPGQTEVKPKKKTREATVEPEVVDAANDAEGITDGPSGQSEPIVVDENNSVEVQDSGE